MDMISKLPIGIIETILCLIPIQEAARTSVLSKEWRYRWIKIRKLAFIEESFQVSTDGPKLSALGQAVDDPSKKLEASRCKLFNAIYQVLLIHEGPIDEFTLFMELEGPCVEVDHILLHLSKKNTVKKLELELLSSYGDVYKLPISFFSLHQLTDLRLMNCALFHERSFNEFGHLTTLHLVNIKIYEKTLLGLLTSCPLLKSLTLNIFEEDILYSQDCNIVDLFECLPGIEYLYISCFIVASFVPERLPKVLPSSLVHLKHLYVDNVCISHKYELPFFALLVRSSPSLVKLELTMYPAYFLVEDEVGSFTLEDYSDLVLEHLNELTFKGFSDSKHELDFVKLIFAKSPVLKRVEIRLRNCFDEDEQLRISELLLNSPCASPVVQKFIRCLRDDFD